jgi:pilus assembly protein CpaF
MSLFKRFVEEPKSNAGQKNMVYTKKSKEFWELESNLHSHLIEELKKNPSRNKIEEKMKIHDLGQVFLELEAGRLTFEEKREIITFVEHELLAFGPITPL